MNNLAFRLATALCLIGPLAGGDSLIAADLGVQKGTQWFPYMEWKVANPTSSASAFDARASVEFTHEPSGEKHRTEMFFAGQKTWAFRFTATMAGTWSFVTFSEDKDLRGHTGRVEISPNPRRNAHGFLKRFGNKWGWEGTENAFVPQLVMWDYIAGDGSPKAIRENPKLADDMIQEFMLGHGFNGFHVAVIGGRWFDLDADTDRVVSTMTEPDPRTFEALELLITRTHRAGGMVHIWPWGDHQRSQTPRSLAGGIGGEIDYRLQRYIAARLGPIPGWSMGYGFDLDEWVTAKHVKAWRDSMHEHMGWHHFLGGRPVGPNHGPDHTADATWNNGLDYSGYEHHRPTYEVYVAALQALPNKPVMSEDRFRVRTGRYPEKDYSTELTRRGLYDSTMAGGVANIWGIHPSLGPHGVYPNKTQIKTYAVFFHDKQRFLPDMTPASHLSSDARTRVLLSRETQSLILYRQDTDKIRVDLSSMSGPLPAIAVDTTKAYREIPLGNIRPEAQTITLPAFSNWIVAVGHFAPTPKDRASRTGSKP